MEQEEPSDGRMLSESNDPITFQAMIPIPLT